LSEPVQYLFTLECHGTELAEIRAQAMRPSLEHLNRYDDAMVRKRFLDSFVPEYTTRIIHQQSLVGFFVVIPEAEFLFLNHLYLLPEVQGAGIGGSIVSQIQSQAETLGKKARLAALAESPANDFYLARGFKLTHRDTFDNYYEWQA